jgi:hypothetical protein
MKVKMVKTIRCILTYELEFERAINQEAADAMEIGDIQEGGLVEQKFVYLDSKGKKIDPR